VRFGEGTLTDNMMTKDTNGVWSVIIGPVSSGPQGEDYAALKKEIVTDIIPFVAKRYRTIENREKRAIADLSVGGVTWYADYDIEKIAPGIYQDIAVTNKKLNALFMSCGTEDPSFPFQKKASEDLQKRGIKVMFASYPGSHEWRVFRRALNDFAQQIFK
jgi:enterochelin esterase-like enzyme